MTWGHHNTPRIMSYSLTFGSSELTQPERDQSIAPNLHGSPSRRPYSSILSKRRMIAAQVFTELCQIYKMLTTIFLFPQNLRELLSISFFDQ